jgi:hypothetical protein
MQEEVNLQKHRFDTFRPNNVKTYYWIDTRMMICGFWNVAQCRPQKQAGL